MKRAKHSLSHYKLLSMDMGELVPVGLTEVLPGDSFQHGASALIRVSPLLAPVMHPVHVRVHHWFVPHRIIWDDFESFITGGPDGLDASAFPTKNFTLATSTEIGTLSDYFGVPTGVNPITVSALPYRAYAAIFNEWYRDEDLVSELAINTTSGAESGTLTNSALQNVAWEKDYFTSARPWTQKGSEVTIPLVGNAPITGIGIDDSNAAAGFSNTDITARESDGSTKVYSDNWASVTAGLYVDASTASSATADPAIFADLSGVTAASINDLRLAFALQRYKEARARYGSRYTEYLRYLGVRSSDARLQRPEYLGGGRQTIQFSEVLQTAEGTNPVGELRGHGIAGVRSRRYRRFFEEHGYVVSLMSVLPKTMYSQGLARHFNRRAKEDFWQKELEHIGQQEVLNKEIYAAHATPEGTFGYQDRYDEYRRCESSIGGEFRDSTLNFWHMAREFGSDPTLNSTFVQSNPTNRIFASATNDTLWCMVNHSLQARRMVSKTGSSFIF